MNKHEINTRGAIMYTELSKSFSAFSTLPYIITTFSIFSLRSKFGIARLSGLVLDILLER